METISREDQEIKIAWSPQPGPQTLLLSCPATEIFFGGARGGGKSDGINGDWLAHWGRHGIKAKGVIFRQTYKQLTDLLKRQYEIFPKLGAKYNQGNDEWTFPDGAKLELRYVRTAKDAREYQGFQWNWMAIEEIGEWLDSEPLDLLKATLRSADGVPIRLILTANPGGAGHNWVKAKYIDPAPPFTMWLDEDTGFTIVFIPAKLEDNPALMKNDPGYEKRLNASGSAWLVDAWKNGNWDIVPDQPGALWNREMLGKLRVGKIPDGVKIVRAAVAIDPSVSNTPGSDECGLAVGVKCNDGHGYLLRDESGVMSPDAWVSKALWLYESMDLDRIIGEANNGGDLIEALLRSKEGAEHVSYKKVYASRGKVARAEPIAALYEQGKIHHVGPFKLLENQLCRLVPGEEKKFGSPDRADAMVWLFTFLMLKPKNKLRVT